MTATAYTRLVEALRAAGSSVTERGDKATAQCPAHDDNTPSLSINPRDDGKGVVVKCHADCDYTTVLGALGLAPRDLFDESLKRAAYSDRTTYSYPDGRKVHRGRNGDGKKTFRQSGDTKGNALFHADKITADTTRVFVAEGEKDVLAIESEGAVAVCSAMGAGKAAKFDWSPLTGKQVIIVADCDEPGRKHARDVYDIVAPIAASVTVVEAAVGKDAADHIAAGRGLDEFVDAASDDDGAALLDELRDALTRFVAFPSAHAAAAVTLWIAVTHALPAFECAPRLVFTSPQKRCGKTRALDVVQALSHNPLATADATVAAIFRSIGDGHPPTLFIDEADAIWGSKKLAEQHEDLRKLLNAGHQRGRPALRCVGPSQIPTPFATFAMVALAGIGDCIPDTITDRAINIMLRRRSSAEKVAAYRSRRDAPQLEGLGKRLGEWAVKQIQQLQGAEPSMPVEDRAADTWEPLIAVADAAGGHWPATARAACIALVGEADSADEDRSYGMRLLADIKAIFEEHGGSFLPSQELVNKLRAIDESPWSDFELTRSKLAYRLREYGIKTGHNPSGSARGYRLECFRDAFERYTRQESSEPSDTQVTPTFSSDGSKPSDGSTRQTKTTRQTKNSPPSGNLTVLTVPDGGTAQNVQPDPIPGALTPDSPGQTDRMKQAHAKATANTQPACSVCGEPLWAPASIERGLCERCHLAATPDIAERADAEPAI